MAPPSPVHVAPFGEEAVYVDLGLATAPDRAERTLAVAAALRARLPGAEVIVGAGTLVVAGLAPGVAVEAAVAGAVASAPPLPAAGRTHAFPVVYDGPDLASLAPRLGLSPAALVALHAGRAYLAELVGFLPGFAYLGPVDARLVAPRLPSPRTSVPPGSVGLAGGFTGVYPFASPGGWNLIGRALGPAPFDPERAPAALVAPGDRVRFVPADAAPSSHGAPPPAALRAEPPAGARALEILAAPACATLQDGGRRGRLGGGLPPSGPLDPAAHAAANLAAGNPAGACAIEVPLGSLEVRARGRLLVSIDGAAPLRLADGETLRVPEGAGAVRYLAVGGGLDVPLVLGSRSTLLVARLGGHHGRALRRRDVLPVGGEGDTCPPGGARDGDPLPDGELTVIPGPHLDRFPPQALDVLLSTPWQVSRVGDRVGVRLDGGRIPRAGAADLALPAPMIRGVVEVATDGTPIVLGPDHPTTGGYPVLGVLDRASQARLSRCRPGAGVRFTARAR